MKKFRCKISGCSNADLIKLARKSGFSIIEGKNHTKVQTAQGKFITIIPRHNPVKKNIAKGIIEAFNYFGANIEIC